MYDQSICRVIHSQHVTFNESVRGVEKESMKDAVITNPQTVVDTINDENDSSIEMVVKDGAIDENRNEENCTEPEGGNTEITVRQSQRETRRPNFYGELVNSAKIISEPTTVEEALSCPYKKNWKEAMEDEFQSDNLTKPLHTEQFT